MRLIIQYFISFVLILIYGGEVCPFLESLKIPELAIPVAGGLIIQMFLSFIPIKKYINNLVFHEQSKIIFISQLSLFVFFGFLMALYNMAFFDFPLLSGLKLTIAMAVLGVFISADLSLEKEREIAKHFLKTKQQNDIKGEFFPVTAKFALLSITISVLVIGIFFLVVNKDLDWMVEVGSTITPDHARRVILIEIIFVVSVILGFTLNLILSYSKNMNFFFKNETNTLEKAANGDLEGFVPVSTKDEFGKMAIYTNKMIKGLKDKNEEIQKTQDITIRTLVSVGEARDNETGAHIQRTQHYVKILAMELKNNEKFKEYLTDDKIDHIFKSAPLHDIGKVGIPDAILLKPGKLDKDEWEIMKTHAQIGGKALSEAKEELGQKSFLKYGAEIANCHHEKYDGSGYPKGLIGDEIPVSAKLMSLADVYDALISKRVYKPAFSHEKAKSIILEGKGSHFDPDVVEAFLKKEEDFIKTAKIYKDNH